MQFAELRYVCQEAAIDLVRTQPRPVPPTVVLPGPERTRLLRLPDFPDEDEERHALLARLASDELTGRGIPAWGFLAEAVVEDEDALVIVYGARQHAPEITASRFGDDGELVEFAPAEPLDPTALPFLHPLQHAVDSLPPLDSGPGPLDA